MFPDILTVQTGNVAYNAVHNTVHGAANRVISTVPTTVQFARSKVVQSSEIQQRPRIEDKEKSGKILSFPQKNTPVRSTRVGKEQKVYPIRRYEDLLSMANWLYLNKDRKYALAFIIGCNIGLRANELLQLRYSQVFDERGEVRYREDLTDTFDVIYIYQGKTDKNRPIFLNKACKDALEWFFPKRNSLLFSTDFLFPSREGGHIEVDTFRKVMKEAAAACGIRENIGTHTLRKTFGHHLWIQDPDARTDVTLIQAIYGHSDPRITMRYLGLDIYEFKRAYRKLNLNIVSDPAFAGKNIASRKRG